MPFSHEAFFDAFGTYNDSVWPFALMLWVATLVVFNMLPGARVGTRAVFALLAIQWAWSGLVYHAAIFSRINPAAWVFAALFLIQAGVFAWYSRESARLEFLDDGSPTVLLGYALIAYALLYPLLSLAGGHAYPRVPTFGLPCPTTLVTVGFLTALRGRVPARLAVIPIVWAAIAASAAFVFGVYADLMLVVAGIVLALRTSFMRTTVAG